MCVSEISAQIALPPQCIRSNSALQGESMARVPISKELNMSGINGDKSRFHRERKQKIERRRRNREMLKNIAKQPPRGVPASESKPETESA